MDEHTKLMTDHAAKVFVIYINEYNQRLQIHNGKRLEKESAEHSLSYSSASFVAYHKITGLPPQVTIQRNEEDDVT